MRRHPQELGENRGTGRIPANLPNHIHPRIAVYLIIATVEYRVVDYETGEYDVHEVGSAARPVVV